MRVGSVAFSLLLIAGCAPGRTEGTTPPARAAGGVEGPDQQPHEDVRAGVGSTTDPTASHTASVDAEPESTWPTLKLAIDAPTRPYDRDEWNHWIDEDGDCQDTRAEVLIAQSGEPVSFASTRKCRVVAGLWIDPYTGDSFTEARRLDIDHIVPLKDAHDSGAWAWTAEKREGFANDPRNLLAVSASANRSKGAKDPAGWMPKVDVCSYLVAWLEVKVAYDLGVDQEELEILERSRTRCVGAEAFSGSPAPRPNAKTPSSSTSQGNVQCCKVCRKSKACGDSCISANKTCHSEPGCACDG